jgi:hypothetical protein
MSRVSVAPDFAGLGRRSEATGAAGRVAHVAGRPYLQTRRPLHPFRRGWSRPSEAGGDGGSTGAGRGQLPCLPPDLPTGPLSR